MPVLETQSVTASCTTTRRRLQRLTPERIGSVLDAGAHGGAGSERETFRAGPEARGTRDCRRPVRPRDPVDHGIRDGPSGRPEDRGYSRRLAASEAILQQSAVSGEAGNRQPRDLGGVVPPAEKDRVLPSRVALEGASLASVERAALELEAPRGRGREALGAGRRRSRRDSAWPPRAARPGAPPPGGRSASGGRPRASRDACRDPSGPARRSSWSPRRCPMSWSSAATIKGSGEPASRADRAAWSACSDCGTHSTE